MHPAFLLLFGGALVAAKRSRSRAPKRIYLDHNATTEPHPRAVAAMRRARASGWANPSSSHADGRRAKAFLDRARQAVARLVAIDGAEVTLTSGGTEANNLALNAPFAGGQRGALVVSRIEHPSVQRAAEALAARGVVVRWIDPAADGTVPAGDFRAVLDELHAAGQRCPLVSLMACNHETGVIQPVAEVARVAHQRGALLHVDAVQAVGKLSPELWNAADIVTVAAHKIRGPKAIGAIVTRPGVQLSPLVRGGGQGVRPGTQSGELAAGFAAAAELGLRTPPLFEQLREKRDDFEQGARAIGRRLGVKVETNGTAHRAPHVSNLSLNPCTGTELCAKLDELGIAASNGAACSTGEPSKVITAIAGEQRAREAVRFSLGLQTTDAQIERTLDALEAAMVATRRARSGPG